MAHKILVIRFGSLGDVVLTSATILNLKLAYPNSHLTFLTKERFSSIARLIAGVDEVLALPQGENAGSYYSFLIELDKRNFDLIVDLHGNARSWLARRLLSAAQVVAYPKRRIDRQLLVRQKQKSYPVDWPHTIDLYNGALHSLCVPLYCKRPLLRHPRSNLAAAFGLLSSKYIIIAPGAAHAPKQWPAERFAEVARQLYDLFGMPIVWPVTGQDTGRSGLETMLPAGAFRELVDCPLDQLVELIAGARLMISNDTGLMHVASAVGTPVVALFGPTHPTLGFAPRGLFDRVLQVDEPCRPCSLHGKTPCFREEQFCFTRITPRAVVDVSVELLQSPLEKALFLDRDGTVMVDKHYLADPDQVELIPGAVEALAAAQQAGYRLVLLSNQSGVARGMFNIASVEAVQARLQAQLARAGVVLAATAYCPHFRRGTVPEYSVSCDCRKPYPGMAEKAALQLGINLHQSAVIGDKVDDLMLGMVIGARSILVRTGHGQETEQSLHRNHLPHEIMVHNSLLEAVQYLKGPQHQ